MRGVFPQRHGPGLKAGVKGITVLITDAQAIHDEEIAGRFAVAVQLDLGRRSTRRPSGRPRTPLEEALETLHVRLSRRMVLGDSRPGKGRTRGGAAHTWRSELLSEGIGSDYPILRTYSRTKHVRRKINTAKNFIKVAFPRVCCQGRYDCMPRLWGKKSRTKSIFGANWFIPKQIAPRPVETEIGQVF